MGFLLAWRAKTSLFLEGMAWNDTDGAIVLQDGRVNFFDAGASRLAKGRMQLLMRQLRPGHNLLNQFTVMNEH